MLFLRNRWCGSKSSSSPWLARKRVLCAASALLWASFATAAPAVAQSDGPTLWFPPLFGIEAGAADGATGPEKSVGDRHFEASFGADVGTHYWFLYSGATLAPFGDMHANGLRLRATGGYGAYDYVGPLKRRYSATTSFYEALAGYLHTFGPLTAKAFIGVAQIDHSTSEADRPGLLSGSEIGFKGVLEFWLNIDADWYASLDLAYASAHETRSARARVGYRFDPQFSFGVEARFNQDSQADYKMSAAERPELQTDPLDYAWIGAFARYEWDTGEISASAGVNAGGLAPGGWFEDDPSVYGTISFLTRF